MAIGILIGRDQKEQIEGEWFIQDVSRQLRKINPDADIRIWPDIGQANDVDLVMVWRHPLGAIKQFPQLKCIASLAAGVDHVLVDPELSSDIPIIRVMDPYMANDIVQYVLAYVLHHIKRVDHWDNYQQQKTWARKPPFNLSEKTIGLMGMGFLGKKTATALQTIGLNVIGWSQTPKTLNGMKHFSGDSEFSDFLSQTDILVCLLPLTPKTENIINHKNLSQLKNNACLINLGRGAHLVEKDLITLLDSGKLHYAYLDVFREEPLPVEHPFWSHPKIRVTPHIASVTHPKTAVPQLIEVYQKLLTGESVENLVDIARGY